MKTRSFLLLLTFLGFGLIAQTSYASRVKGSGNVITETRKVSGFHAIDIGGAFEIELVKSSEEKIIIETDDNIMPIIETSVSGGELSVENKRDINNPTKLKLTIFYLNLDEIDISGAAELYSKDVLTAENLNLECSGASEVSLKIEAGTMDTEFSGASKVELEGHANSVKLDISGAAVIQAYGFEIKNLDLDASGAAVVKVLILDKLRIDASGASSVKYKGDPSIDIIDISGASSVRKG